ncbi:hypothetical protein ZWY2020_014565 [Hordeum vulgare]|nr:hypothetical protein ZWY2020_014565 [Hordeum vulgare]
MATDGKLARSMALGVAEGGGGGGDSLMCSLGAPLVCVRAGKKGREEEDNKSRRSDTCPQTAPHLAPDSRHRLHSRSRSPQAALNERAGCIAGIFGVRGEYARGAGGEAQQLRWHGRGRGARFGGAGGYAGGAGGEAQQLRRR